MPILGPAYPVPVVVDDPEPQNRVYSVFISNQPYVSPLFPNTFTYLCSKATVDYNLNYSGTTTGILGRGPDQSIFVDGATGAVGNISISGIRCNPQTSQTSVNVSSELSNAQFYNKMRSVLTENQWMQGAYIIRIYNVDWTDIDTTNPQKVENYKNSYRELYVHISKFDMEFDWKNTNEASINMTLIRRNKLKGFGDA